MADFYNNGKEPGWQYAWGDTIEKVVVGEGVTSVNTLGAHPVNDSTIRMPANIISSVFFIIVLSLSLFTSY